MRVPPLFDQLSIPEQQALLHIGRRKNYQRRAVLCFEGDPSSELFVLLSGWVKAWTSTERGKLLLLRVHQRGDLLGAEPVLADQPRPETLKAEGEIEVLAIPAERFTTFLALHPWVARTVNGMFVLRLTDAYRQRAHEVANDSPHRRLAEVLIDLRGQLGCRCQRDDSFVELRVPCRRKNWVAQPDCRAQRYQGAQRLALMRSRHDRLSEPEDLHIPHAPRLVPRPAPGRRAAG
ncbi:Crp/Fnr family transcriptional regulator [Actinomadura syzygii]|uniref:Crp/Fnr family transcriptional regulator n=1 Tax=Actinomadura syzygii TaxID=1427538 RepID=A0A5D0TNA4_9ACTN|nr:Crp/Fnr family transcriptional regulator [Actinomadura syzygii]